MISKLQQSGDGIKKAIQIRLLKILNSLEVSYRIGQVYVRYGFSSFLLNFRRRFGDHFNRISCLAQLGLDYNLS